MIIRKAAVGEGEQLRELLGKLRRRLTASQCMGRDLIRSGSTPKTEVNASGMKRLEQAEVLDDLKWRVVWEHDPARTNTDPRGGLGNVPDHERRGRTRHSRCVVVFGEPVAVVAEDIRPPGKVDGVARRVAR